MSAGYGRGVTRKVRRGHRRRPVPGCACRRLRAVPRRAPSTPAGHIQAVDNPPTREYTARDPVLDPGVDAPRPLSWNPAYTTREECRGPAYTTRNRCPGVRRIRRATDVPGPGVYGPDPNSRGPDRSGLGPCQARTDGRRCRRTAPPPSGALGTPLPAGGHPGDPDRGRDRVLGQRPATRPRSSTSSDAPGARETTTGSPSSSWSPRRAGSSWGTCRRRREG